MGFSGAPVTFFLAAWWTDTTVLLTAAAWERGGGREREDKELQVDRWANRVTLGLVAWTYYNGYMLVCVCECVCVYL